MTITRSRDAIRFFNVLFLLNSYPLFLFGMTLPALCYKAGRTMVLRKNFLCPFSGIKKRPQTAAFVVTLPPRVFTGITGAVSFFVGLLTYASRRLPACASPSPSQPYNRPVTRFRGKEGCSALTAPPGDSSPGRVPVLHRIPLFSRTRMRTFLPLTRSGRAFATKAGAFSVVCFIISSNWGTVNVISCPLDSAGSTGCTESTSFKLLRPFGQYNLFTAISGTLSR